MRELKSHYRPGTYQRGEDTRRRILDTAFEVFAAEGYDGTSTRMLAERAGINLPAIQYYFGSKEGLYRAVIERIVQQIEDRMAPVCAAVEAALGDRRLPRRELLSLLHVMTDAFVALVLGGEHQDSRRLLFARAEIEQSVALNLLHESGMKQVFKPCAALVGRLMERPPEDEQVVLRTLMLIGQVVIFCNKGARRALGTSDYGEGRIKKIQALLREQTDATFRAPKGAGR